MDGTVYWKRLGIRLLRFFGVACTFVGYIIVVSSIIFGFSQFKSTGLGLGLIGLGVPHILAANRLQKNAEYADPAFGRALEPRFARLLATSLILPGVVLILLVAFVGDGPRPNPAFHLYFATIIVYFVGAWIVFYRRASGWNPSSELTPWDRTYIRWGWLVLFAMGIPITMAFTR